MMRKTLATLMLMFTIAPMLLMLSLGWVSLGALPGLGRMEGTSPLWVDQDGAWLGIAPAPDGRWRLPGDASAVSPLYLGMLRGWEDRRWADHHGVDGRAVARAGWQMLRYQRVVSGASTLSMQTARLLKGADTRSFSGKLAQMRDALRLEAQLGKAATLNAYLTLLPCGGALEGAEICARAWFGHSARNLTAAQAALLVAMPQSPEARRPDKHPQAARQARDRILRHSHALGLIDQRSLTEALATPVPRQLHSFPDLAPHLRDHIPRGGQLHITHDLQRHLAQWRGSNAGRLPDGTEIAIVLMDWRSGQGRAHIGGRGHDLARPGGMVDHTLAIRSPGSTLKPFVHALAHDRRIALPRTLLPDLPARFGAWTPENIDGEWRGWMTADEALRRSRNLPVLHLARELGVPALTTGMAQLGLRLHAPNNQPGLPLVLGGVGVTLQDLTQAYARLAGGAQPLHWMGETPALPPAISQEAAHAVLAALSPRTEGASPWAAAHGTALAFKTGTSHGQRDGWTVGIIGPYALGMWVGRTDGQPAPHLSGVGLVAELWRDLALSLPLGDAPPPPFASSLSAQIPPPTLARLGGDSPLPGAAATALRFTLGPGPHQVATGASIPLEVTGGQRPLTLLVNGQIDGPPDWRRSRIFTPPATGYYTLRIIDATGADAEMSVEVLSIADK